MPDSLPTKKGKPLPKRVTPKLRFGAKPNRAEPGFEPNRQWLARNSNARDATAISLTRDLSHSFRHLRRRAEEPEATIIRLDHPAETLKPAS